MRRLAVFPVWALLLPCAGAVLDADVLGRPVYAQGVTCDQNCHEAFEHYYTTGQCVKWSFSSCLLCGQPGANAECGPSTDLGSDCNQNGQNIITDFDSCGLRCTNLARAILEAKDMSGMGTNPRAMDRYRCSTIIP